jgi:hypothetical protein
LEVKSVSTTTKWLAGLNSLLGLWLIAVPFVLTVPTTAMWNAVIVGGLIAVLGGYNYYLTSQGEEVSVAVASLNTLLGLWVIAAPFVFRPGTVALWNDVIVGALVASFGGYNAYRANRVAKSVGEPTQSGA